METPEKCKNVLIFSSREICYLSSDFFANQIGAAFEDIGLTAEICELSKGDDLDIGLKPYIGKEYRLILDFNSLLKRAVMEDHTPYLDLLKGPFFDFLLDHPLFHYNGLETEAENLHVLVLDEAQECYVRQHHPRVKSVHMLPLGATEALCQEKKKEADSVLFMGTYDTPDSVYEIVKASPEPLCTMMKNLIERRLADPLLPMEEAFRQYLLENDLALSAEQFALLMNAMYPVDAYIRDYFRKAALDELLSSEIPVTVVGEGWNKYHTVQETLLKREKGVPFSRSFERIAKEHVLLNVSPFFNRGMHDRIPAGMANHTAVISDENPYLAQRFTDQTDISLYSLNKLSSLSEQAGRLLGDKSLREKLAHHAYLKFSSEHTWKCRAAQILKWADEVYAKG